MPVTPGVEGAAFGSVVTAGRGGGGITGRAGSRVRGVGNTGGLGRREAHRRGPRTAPARGVTDSVTPAKGVTRLRDAPSAAVTGLTRPAPARPAVRRARVCQRGRGAAPARSGVAGPVGFHPSDHPGGARPGDSSATRCPSLRCHSVLLCL